MRYRVELLRRGELLFEGVVQAQAPGEAIKIAARQAGLLRGWRGVWAQRIPPGHTWHWQPSRPGAGGTLLGSTYQAHVWEVR